MLKHENVKNYRNQRHWGPIFLKWYDSTLKWLSDMSETLLNQNLELQALVHFKVSLLMISDIWSRIPELLKCSKLNFTLR